MGLVLLSRFSQTLPLSIGKQSHDLSDNDLAMTTSHGSSTCTPRHNLCPQERSAPLIIMSTRRGVGLGAFANRTQTSQSYANHGANLRSAHLASLQTQLSVFQSLLHTFALEHSSTIKSNPTFRAEFARMCNAIGVDPLAASNVKGKSGRRGESGSFWTQIMGGDMNDFYFEVAVRVVELCRSTRSENGGLLGVEECRKQVGKGKAIGSGLEVTEYGFILFFHLFGLC